MSRETAANDRSVTPCRITPCQSTSPLVTRPKRDVIAFTSKSTKMGARGSSERGILCERFRVLTSSSNGDHLERLI